ncbi:MAG: response regulator [Planctomycetota bacterium]
MKILLVDDSKTMRNIQKKCLGELATDIAEAGDGVEALAEIGNEVGKFGLIMIDWNMPNMNGFELVQKIREFDKSTPLIMCTTEAEKARVVEAIKAGVNNYVIKPFTPDSMMEKVNATLAKIAA